MGEEIVETAKIVGNVVIETIVDWLITVVMFRAITALCFGFDLGLDVATGVWGILKILEYRLEWLELKFRKEKEQREE